METLKEKLENAIINVSVNSVEYNRERIPEYNYDILIDDIERIAIQSQIELLKEETERLKSQSEGLKELLKPNYSMSNNIIEGKMSGIKIAIENLRQSIKSLESQLNKE